MPKLYFLSGEGEDEMSMPKLYFVSGEGEREMPMPKWYFHSSECEGVPPMPKCCFGFGMLASLSLSSKSCRVSVKIVCLCRNYFQA